jgi:hypothetical protein
LANDEGVKIVNVGDMIYNQFMNGKLEAKFTDEYFSYNGVRSKMSSSKRFVSNSDGNTVSRVKSLDEDLSWTKLN